MYLIISIFGAIHHKYTMALTSFYINNYIGRFGDMTYNVEQVLMPFQCEYWIVNIKLCTKKSQNRPLKKVEKDGSIKAFQEYVTRSRGMCRMSLILILSYRPKEVTNDKMFYIV